MCWHAAQKNYRPKYPVVLIILLALSPMAYIAGVILILQHEPNAHVGISIDRAKAISIAAQFAAAKGIEVGDWDQFCRFKPENNLLFYYRLRSGAERDLARQLAPEAVIGIRFRSPDRKENIEVLLGPDGRTLGYERKISKSAEYVDPGEEPARRTAEEAVRVRLQTVGMSKPVILNPGEVTGEGGQVRKYVWRWPLPSIPELEFQSVIYVRGQTLVGDIVTAEVEGSFAKKYLNTSRASRVISSTFYGLIVLIVVIFGIYRFVQRVRQKEVSYSRVCLLTLIFASLTSSFILLSDVVLYDVAGNLNQHPPDLVILFSASMMYLVMALFLGLAYGSGEGDIREAYPGKLASLDALMTGRVFSGNVARSVIGGWAIGGWMLFCTHAVSLPWESNPTNGRELGPLDHWFGSTPWLTPFLITPIDVILVTVIGLLVPLPLLHRRLRQKWLIIPLWSVFIWVACSGPYLTFRPQVAIIVMAAVRTIIVLLSFFMFDLLAVIIGLAAPTLIAFSIALVAQPSPSLRLSGVIALLISLAVIFIELVFLFKGRLYSEDEVRPVYAKNLAERLFMQAEVSAAREAQKRLMPNSLPRMPHFSIAASCLPAFEVGGDFYDLFDIGSGRIGVLIAEGGGKGLGSALSIAFAKGFLMPKLMGGKRSDDSPSEILHALQDRLMIRIAEKEASVGIAYAVIDAADGTVRYARTADYPSILVGKSSALVRPEEKELRFVSNLSSESNVRLIEGSFSLQPGESVILFTGGIARTWADNGSSPDAEFTKVLNLSRNSDTEGLRENLAKSVNDSSKRAKKRGLKDDLTAVIVRLERKDADIDD
jgi:serine phosphatase RsbU (regulator of sigma subunit)